MRHLWIAIVLCSLSAAADKGMKSMAFSPNGKLLAAADAATVRIWNVESRELLQTWEMEEPYAVAWSPDGSALAIADAFVEVRALDGSTIRRMQIPGSWAHQVQWSGDRIVGMGLNSAKVYVWRASTGEVQRVVELENDPWAISLSPDGRWLATIAYGYKPERHGAIAHQLELLDLNTGEPHTHPHFEEVAEISWRADSRSFITAVFGGGAVRVWAVDPLRPVRTWHVYNTASSPLIAIPGSSLVAVMGSRTGLLLWDSRGGQLRRQRRIPQGEDRACVSPDGKTLATAGAGTRVRLWKIPLLEAAGELRD